METIPYTLESPIQAHGETLTVLQVRRPSPLECRQIKAFPYVLGGDGMPVAELEAAARYISLCADIPPSSVNQLSLYDLNQLTWMLIGFFVQPGNTKATNATSTAPVS